MIKLAIANENETFQQNLDQMIHDSFYLIREEGRVIQR